MLHKLQLWPTVKKHLTPGKALYFSHGFGITFNEQTGIIPPKDVDVFLGCSKRFRYFIAQNVFAGSWT